VSFCVDEADSDEDGTEPALRRWGLSWADESVGFWGGTGPTRSVRFCSAACQAVDFASVFRAAAYGGSSWGVCDGGA
jgi:hypothetical protein